MPICYQRKRDINPCSRSFGQIRNEVVPCPPNINCNQNTGSQADLELTLTTANRFIQQGDIITISVALKNGGPDSTTTTISGALPDGLVYQSSTDLQYNTITKLLSKTITNMPGNTTQYASVNVLVQGNVGQDIRFYMQVTASSAFDPDSTPNNGYFTGEDDTSYVEMKIVAAPIVLPTNCFKYSLTKAGDGCVYVLLDMAGVQDKSQPYLCLVVFNYTNTSGQQKQSAYSFQVPSDRLNFMSPQVCYQGGSNISIQSISLSGLNNNNKINSCL